jgi:hypothetical protein
MNCTGKTSGLRGARRMRGRLFKHRNRGFESRSRMDDRPRLYVVLPFVDRGIVMRGKALYQTSERLHNKL